MVATPRPEIQKQAKATVKEVFNYIIAQGNLDYIGEAVSQLEHSFQAAQLASDSGAEWDIILGALLHDIGRFIPAAGKDKRCRK
jgi:predicted HD phosphohydrolase